MFFLGLLSRLPMPVLYFIGDLIFFVIYFVIGYRKKVVLSNLTHAFPTWSLTKRKEVAKEFYRRFSEYIVETLKAITISKEELLRRVDYLNVPDVQPHADHGQSIIVIASHQFNWEWALLAGCLRLPFPVDAVYQKLSNASFDRLMLVTRGKFGGRPIEKSRVLREVLRTKDRTRALGIVADQSPRRKSPKYWTQFLHQDTAFFLGPEQLAKAAQYPAYFFHVKRKSRGYYTVELKPLATPPYSKESHKILENYARLTEQLVQEDPAGYLWTHKRWKLDKANFES